MMGLVLQGVLNAPYPDDPSEMGAVEWLQARSAMRDAWSEIERLRSALVASENAMRAEHGFGPLTEREILSIVMEPHDTKEGDG